MYSKKFINREAAAQGRSQTRAELVGTNGMGIETIKSERNPKIWRGGRNLWRITGFALFVLTLTFVACKKDNRNDSNSNKEENKKWVQKANYPGAAVKNAVAFSANGKIYVGMGNGQAGVKNDLWEYDPTTNKWKEKSDFPGTTNAVDFIMGNKLYVIDPQGSMYEYDPEIDKWTGKSSLDLGGNWYQIAMGFGFGINNKGYVFYKKYEYKYPYKAFINAEYNPATDTWIERGESEIAGIKYLSAATEQMGYLLIASGTLNFFIFNPSNDKWLQKADCISGFTYNTGLNSSNVYYHYTTAGIAYCKDGSFYTGLGVATNGDTEGIYKYDNDANSWNWSITADVLKGRQHAIAVMCNGKLYVGLGLKDGYCLDFWEYTF